jgi:chromosome segregation protein
MDIKKAKEKLANTIRATNEEKITLQELVGAVQNETKRLEELKEKESSVLVEIDKGKETVKGQKEEIEKLNDEKGLVSTSLGAIEQVLSDAKWQVGDLQEKSKELSKQLNKENGNKEKVIKELDSKITLLNTKLEDKENEFSNKINTLTSQEIEIEKKIEDGEKRIEELVKEEKEAKDKAIVSVNDIEIRTEAVKELKTEISELEQEKEEKQNQIKPIEEDIKKVEAKKNEKTKEYDKECVKVSGLIDRENIVGLKEKQLKDLYSKIGKEIKL